jgi:hypothetical protein
MRQSQPILSKALDLLILKTISFESTQRWAIARRIQLVSQEAFQIQQGPDARRGTVWTSRPGSRPGGAQPRPGEW